MPAKTARKAAPLVSVKVGGWYRTPWEPSGIVEVLEIIPAGYFGEDAVRIKHVNDHPKGYPAGSFGAYLLKEMRPLREDDPCPLG